jgi:hypothetical protein
MIDFTHKSGDTFYACPFEVKKDGIALDLTTVGIRLQIRKQNTARCEFEMNIANGKLEIVNALQGRFRIVNQIIKLESYNYVYDIQFTFANGTVKTWVTGKFLITNDVTR